MAPGLLGRVRKKPREAVTAFVKPFRLPRKSWTIAPRRANRNAFASYASTIAR